MRFLFLMMLIPTLSFAEGHCVKKPDAHTMTCEDRDEKSCKFSSDICEWKEKEVVKVVIEEKKAAKASCQAQEGKEIHEDFCKDNDKFECKTHSSLCEWK